MAFDWIRNQNKLGEAPVKSSKPGSTQITRASAAPLPQGMVVRDGEFRTEISSDTTSPLSFMGGVGSTDQTRDQMAKKLFSRRKSKKSSGKSESEYSYGQD